MFSKIHDWWENQTRYKLTELEESLVTIISSILEDSETEVYTSDDGPYFLHYKGGICRITDSCVKLYCHDKLVLHDITPGMAYKLRKLVRDRINKDITAMENQLNSEIIDFIKKL